MSMGAFQQLEQMKLDTKILWREIIFRIRQLIIEKFSREVQNVKLIMKCLCSITYIKF